jgi:hypothetical protein
MLANKYRKANKLTKPNYVVVASDGLIASSLKEQFEVCNGGI